jgi:DNA-binding FadR family transcriptional regulator
MADQMGPKDLMDISTTKAPVPAQSSPIDRIEHAPAHELVVDQIRRAIQLGRFLPGDKLPAERDLAGLLGVSRATVREAIRVLEADGAVSVRRGAHGGLVVNRLHAMDTRTLRARLKKQTRELNDIFDYRLAVECMAARLAAQHRSAEDLLHLEDALERMAALAASAHGEHGAHSTALFNAADTEFHLGIASATANPYLIDGAEQVRRAMFLPVGAVFNALRPDANDSHAAIFEAIRTGDGDAAERHMRQHTEATRNAMADLLKPRDT